MIVQRLRAIQNRFGYLPDAELERLAEEIGQPLYRIEEVASYFPGYRRYRPPGLLVRVCRDMTCHLRGAAELTATLADHALTDALSGAMRAALTAEVETRNRELKAAGRKLLPLPTAEDCRVQVEGVSCLGRCDRAPAIWVERHPMPHSRFAWLKAGRDAEALGLMPKDPAHPHGRHCWIYAGRKANDLANILGRIANGEDLRDDATYRFQTNGGWSTDALPAGRWEIDYYAWANMPRKYEAARIVAAFLKELGKPLRPPPDAPGRKLTEKDLDEFVKERHWILWRLKQANLLGMGGAGAPAYAKWRDVWREPGPDKYIVANGDESEPGTFKDRELMLRAPHLLVEGMVLAGLLTGATKGFIFVRHEYQEQIAAVRAEIDRAERLGACGRNIYDSGADFPIEVYESPGGYILGEQSALLEAMEDRRGQPRNRPPELGTNGLRDRPTVVNNIETLCWVPSIVLRDETAPHYATAGWAAPTGDPNPPRFAGRRLFSVSGDVNRPGVYEVPIGIPLGELLDSPEYCGGVTGEFAALAPSGPSGGIVPARLPVSPRIPDRIADPMMAWFVKTYLPPGTTHLDLRVLPLDLNFFRALNAVLGLPVELMLGAGMVVYAGPVNALDHAVNFTRFFRNESCGKCTPCRIGSEKLVQLGTELLAGRGSRAAFQPLVRELTRTLQQTSICGLGYVAPIPMQSALEYFPNGRT